jgi:hypothetical protein
LWMWWWTFGLWCHGVSYRRINVCPSLFRTVWSSGLNRFPKHLLGRVFPGRGCHCVSPADHLIFRVSCIITVSPCWTGWYQRTLGASICTSPLVVLIQHQDSASSTARLRNCRANGS